MVLRMSRSLDVQCNTRRIIIVKDIHSLNVMNIMLFYTQIVHVVWQKPTQAILKKSKNFFDWGRIRRRAACQTQSDGDQ